MASAHFVAYRGTQSHGKHAHSLVVICTQIRDKLELSPIFRPVATKLIYNLFQKSWDKNTAVAVAEWIEGGGVEMGRKISQNYFMRVDRKCVGFLLIT